MGRPLVQSAAPGGQWLGRRWISASVVYIGDNREGYGGVSADKTRDGDDRQRQGRRAGDSDRHRLGVDGDGLRETADEDRDVVGRA